MIGNTFSTLYSTRQATIYSLLPSSTKVILKVNDCNEVDSRVAFKVTFANPPSQVLSVGVLILMVALVFIKVIKAIKIKTTTFFIFK